MHKVLFLLLAIVLSGCSLVSHGLATLQSTSAFTALESDKRVFYEEGGKEFALEVAGYLHNAIALVESEHFGPFSGPVEVYICASKESFAQFTGEPKVVRGALTIRHLFLSAERIKELKDDTLQAVLTHELSHLYLQQHLGAYAYGSKLPAWFQEGLAEYVSGGAAMEEVIEAEAAKAILEGQHFAPEATGSFFFPKRWNVYDLKPHMFYRQSAMFVTYLKHYNEKGFRALLTAIMKGTNFKESFSIAYKMSLNEAWEQFIFALKTKLQILSQVKEVGCPENSHKSWTS